MHPDPTAPTGPGDLDAFGPGHHLRAQLAALPAGMPAILMIGTGLTLVGGYTGDVELTGTDGIPSSVAARLMIPACTCEDPDTDVDPDCLRHYPNPPEELVALVARAVAASRHWSFRAGMGPHVEGCTDLDVNAAEAVLTVLLNPGRHGGVFSNEPAPPRPAVDPDAFTAAWARFHAHHPEVLASWGEQNGRMPNCPCCAPPATVE